MRSILAVFTILISAMLASALVVRSGPSGTPCAWKCPSKDTANHSLGQRDESANPITCHYGDNDYCLYSKTSGALTSDHDGGHCPSTALCSTPSRRDALPRSPRQNNARQVEAVELKLRDQLGSAKRSKRSV